MYLERNLRIVSMAEKARKAFNEVDKSMGALESNYHSKMRGRTMTGIFGTILGIAAWVAVFGALAYYGLSYTERNVLMVTAAGLALLLFVMLIDALLTLAFYGKISFYGANISQLRAGIRKGCDSISTTTDAYMKSAANGWDYKLKVGRSVMDEARVIEKHLNRMDVLKHGFINKLKNVLYYLDAILFTVAGSMALFPIVSERLCEKFEISGQVPTVICWVVVVIACVGEYDIARMAWAKSECSVNNLTVFALLAGPLAFLAVMSVGGFVAYLVVAFVKFVISIATTLIIIAVLWCCTSGG
jgi:hypothetical protein